MSSNIHITAAEWEVILALPDDIFEYIEELDAHDNVSAPACAPTLTLAPPVIAPVLAPAVDDKWAFLREHCQNESSTYFSYSAKPGGANRTIPTVLVRVYSGNMLDQACERVSLGTFEKRPRSELEQMARDAGVMFCTGETKRNLARGIIEKEQPAHLTAAGQAEVVRLGKKWAGDEAEEGMWFVGKMEGGQLQMKGCSREEWEQ
ncbi:hypothetical protein DE146DRAFT_754309 [Phaeosphaeria sp. MPI-PUGE-AT-0046c]|nr:hypothetical protein DE146DRAFT_754309 [Phaeosphaeria sp. MPI-PUGE-AT-0046c]